VRTRLALLAVAAAAAGALIATGQAAAQSPPSTPPPPAQALQQLTSERATELFLADRKVRDWVARYPAASLVKEATYDGTYRDWTVKIWSGAAGEIAFGRVDDASGFVKEAWTGPQVAWKMARGGSGAFGGKEINSLPVWLGFSIAFLIGLADFRRPLSLRNLDLLALLSFSVPLWYFNEGRTFTAVILVYPGLVYLLARTAWIGISGRAPVASRPAWPVWALIAATVFLVGFRIGLNVEDSNVIDVGYSGVIGAERIAHGQAPYGHFPVEEKLPACGPADRDGEIRDRIQTNGRCESANPQGDTYGPVSYLAYLPGYAILGWTGKWDDLPAAHFTSIAFDLICLIGLALVGRRLGGWQLAATLAFAWAAYPFTQYASSSNTNDAIMPAFLIWGFWLATSPTARGVAVGLASWTKFAALLLVPLWWTYPDSSRRGLRRDRGGKLRFVAGFAAATAAAFWVLLLEPHPLAAVGTFWDRTVSWQLDRDSPFSLWDWGQYHAAGIPDLHWLQRVLQAALVLGAFASAVVPRRKTPLQLAALSGALLIGFELVLTHWFYLYVPWFFAFAAIAVLVGRPVAERQTVEALDGHQPRELVPAGH
jgi:hypothetical protein